MLPRAHTTHYHGVLAPAHPWRELVVPKEKVLTAPPLKSCGPRWIKWADLLRRVWLAEVLVCRLCGGARRVIAQIEEGPVARKILEHLGLPTRVPSRAPARGQAQGELWGTGPPGADAREEPEVDESPPYDRSTELTAGFDQRNTEADVFA